MDCPWQNKRLTGNHPVAGGQLCRHFYCAVAEAEVIVWTEAAGQYGRQDQETRGAGTAEWRSLGGTAVDRNQVIVIST